MSAHSLTERLRRIRRRVQTAIWLYGLSWIVAVVFGGLLCVGFLDWLLHFDDPIVRLILAVAIAGLGVRTGWRYLVLPRKMPLADIDIALRIERRYPQFKDSLSSTVQFLESGSDPRLGSPELQHRVIDETIREVGQIDIDDVIEPRPVRRVGMTAVLITLILTVVVGFNRTEAATALERLLFPFSARAWPRKTVLRLVRADLRPLVDEASAPLRIVRGDTFEFFVENIKGKLPGDVAIEYQLAESDVYTERLRKTTLRDADDHPRDVCVATLVAHKGPMWFRAVGGDDFQMEWHELQVVPPPQLEEMRVRLTPPSYTRKKPKSLPPGAGHVEGIVGTKVEIVARTNKPVRSAELHVKGRPPQPIKLAGDGRSLKVSLVISQPTVHSYWFEFRDQLGFENVKPTHYEIRGIADTEPKVDILKPISDVQVTPDAVVPLSIIAKDDLGLKTIRLSYSLSESADSPGVLLPLHVAADQTQQKTIQQKNIEYDWNLSSLTLVAGMQIVFHAEATDECNLGPEHIGRSLERTLLIVSIDEKKAELAERLNRLIEDVQRILDAQKLAHNQIGDLIRQAETVGRLRREDVELLTRIELDQRQIAARLLSPTDGIEMRAGELKSEGKNNHVDDPPTQYRLDQIADELEALRREDLPAIEQSLTHARKAAQSAGTKTSPKNSGTGRHTSQPTKPRKSGDAHRRVEQLETVAEQQQLVIESLAEIAQWRTRRDLQQELTELIVAQSETNQMTSELGKKTLTKSVSELTSQQQAELQKLAARQHRQAERLNEFQNRLSESLSESSEPSGRSRETLRDAAEHLAENNTEGNMREAAAQLADNRIGRAALRQQQIVGALNELRDILQNRGESDTETLIKKLKRAETELAELGHQQEELLRKTRAADQMADQNERRLELQKLHKEQKRLRERISSMSRRLRRLTARRAGDASRRAARRMQQAASDLNDEAAARAAEEQQEAVDDLRQAQRELARTRRQAEEKLAREILERMADELAGMIDRQQNLIDETIRLDKAFKTRGNWSRGQLKSLANLSESQRQLKTETDRLAERLTSAEVFALALRGASRLMQKAVMELEKRRTGAQTVAAQQAAKKRFADLVASLKPEKGGSRAEPNAGGPGAGGPQSDQISQLAQLKLLKTLQEDLNRRTESLDAARNPNGVLTDRRREELQEIADEQGTLADLARNLTRAVQRAFEIEDAEDDADDSTDNATDEKEAS